MPAPEVSGVSLRLEMLGKRDLRQPTHDGHMKLLWLNCHGDDGTGGRDSAGNGKLEY